MPKNVRKHRSEPIVSNTPRILQPCIHNTFVLKPSTTSSGRGGGGVCEGLAGESIVNVWELAIISVTMRLSHKTAPRTRA